jgi:predicted RNA polymerase sigma factor
VAGGEASDDARRLAEQALRRSYGKLVAFLAARTGDVAAAEDALSGAVTQALTHWPAKGCPANPEAWLLTVARRKLTDAARRRRTAEAASPDVGLLAEGLAAAQGERAEIPDQRLALMFACAHPAIEAAARAPLMLQTVIGLPAAPIASAFLVSPAAMGQRLVRAKAKIRAAGISFAIPPAEALPDRLEAVLDAIYAAYSEGWSDPGGADPARRDLTDEALYLARLASELAPGEPEALGLLALILYAEARRTARRGPAGEYTPLADQDPALWDGAMIAEAEAALSRAGGMGRVGRYQLEAALQSAHVHRRRTDADNWAEVVRLYDALIALTASPVAVVNRALAVAEAEGSAAGLAAFPDLAADVRLEAYQPYWAARADLLARTGEPADAARAYAIAIGLERDPAVRAFLIRRRAALTN